MRQVFSSTFAAERYFEKVILLAPSLLYMISFKTGFFSFEIKAELNFTAIKVSTANNSKQNV